MCVDQEKNPEKHVDLRRDLLIWRPQVFSANKRMPQH